jgi:hypothetical protein
MQKNTFLIRLAKIRNRKEMLSVELAPTLKNSFSSIICMASPLTLTVCFSRYNDIE